MRENILNIAGIVLAGGLSSRMGKDKAHLILENKTLLEHNIALLGSLPLSDVFVSGHYPEANAISDLIEKGGPIAGVHACVDKLFEQFDALFILPVDMPLLSQEECLHLLYKFTQYPQGVFYKDAMFPMILPLTQPVKTSLNIIAMAADKKQRSLYRLIKTIQLQPVDYQIENRFRFYNSNTPEQWEHCLKKYHALKLNKESS